MYCVYLLRSLARPGRTYIGLTDDVEKRLQSHNSGADRHTASARPRELVVYTAFRDRHRAAQFEKYLKHGSGHAFARRHFW